MENTVNKYVNSRINSLLDDAEVFGNRLQKYRDDIVSLKTIVQEVKKTNPKEGHKTVEKDIISIQENHYMSFLLDQSLKHLLSNIIELKTLATSLEIELDLSPEKEDILRAISEGTKDIFTSEKGEVVFVDRNLEHLILSGMKDKVGSAETVKSLYEAI